MNFEEHAAKRRLRAAGLRTPEGELARNADEAAQAAARTGPCVVKAQAPAGKRGKAGGIKTAADPDEARARAEDILGMDIAGHRIEKVLVEAQVNIARECYAAVLNDPAGKSPLVMFSAEGGMDIEELAASSPDKIITRAVDIRTGFDEAAAGEMLSGLDLGGAGAGVQTALAQLYQAYIENDAELMEVNPLVITADGAVMALDGKYVLDDSAIKRREDLAKEGAPEKLTALEARGEAAGIKYIELDGNVGVLANGAGLTMTTMDVVRFHGGRPANFCEIGGEAYTKAKTAMELVLAKSGVKSLLINFCGAFARCDVMMEGVLNAWDELRPDVPVFFSVAGTGDEAAVKMLKERLNMDPMADMSAACKAASDAAGAAR